MISGIRDHRRKVLLWSALVSAALHLLLLGTLLAVVVRIVMGERGAIEHISEVTPLRIEQRMVQRQPVPKQQPVVRQAVAPPKPVLHHTPAARSATPPRPREVAKIVTHAPPEPPRSSATSRLASQLAAQERDFGKEVAGLNQQDDPHAIPTIEPGAQQPAVKAYHFDVADMQGENDGNGLITPTKRWQQAGQDCYYGRYEYQYGDGKTESGDIVWPFCYNPASDPFNKPPHPIPFPNPLPGYKLPAGTELPHLEQEVYNEWSLGKS